MLYHLLYPLRDFFFGFNVFRYITFRAALAAVTAFLISVAFGPRLIERLKALKMHHSIERAGFREISEKNRHKSETPTMGGLLIIAAVVGTCALWGDLANRFLWVACLATLWLGAIGFADDYLKMVYKNSKGLQAMTKLIGQMALGVAVGIFLYRVVGWDEVHVPFAKNFILPLGALYIAFVCLVLVGSSNAVNLTDGLDGLAIGCTIFIALAYAAFSYLSGHALFSDYLQMPFIPESGELTVFCAAIAGAGLGFLWFNSYPATVFMGDTGSLSLGGALGIVAILVKKELVLLIVGGVFVAEALSVILQVASYKTRKKRIFLMAPVHHHFQLKGWPESKIVIRFWIVSVILALAGLSTLKLR